MKRWVLAFLILELFVSCVLFLQFREERQRLFAAHVDRTLLAWEAARESRLDLQRIIQGALLADGRIASLLSQALATPADRRAPLRTALADRFAPSRPALLAHGITMTQVLLADGATFFRLNNPQRSNAVEPIPRPALREVLASARPVAAVETTSRATALRLISPVFHDARLVGVLETAVPLAEMPALLDHLDKTRRHSLLGPLPAGESGGRLALAPLPPGAGAAPDPETARLVAALGDLGQPLADGHPFARSLAGADADRVITIVPISDYSGESHGYLMANAVEPALETIRRSLIISATVTAFLLLAALLLLAQLVNSRRALLREREDMRAITDTMGEGLYILDNEGLIAFVNRSAETMLGYSREDLLGAKAHSLFHSHDGDGRPQDADACAILRAMRERRHFTSSDEAFIRSNGTRFPVEVRCAPLTADDPLLKALAHQAPPGGPGGRLAARLRAAMGNRPRLSVALSRLFGHADALLLPTNPRASVITFVDITERKASEAALRKLSRAVEQSPASVIITDARGTIEYVNPQFEKSTGYRSWEVIGANPRILKSGHIAEATYAEMWKTLNEGREWRGELHNRRKDGTLYWEYASLSPVKDRRGRTTHLLAVKEDITARKETENRLIRQANFDELTDLPNRSLCYSRLKEAIVEAEATASIVGVLFIDLDHFKNVNDSLGHAVGDKLLTAVAQRLREVARPGDTLSRQGGDEFLMLLPDLNGSEAGHGVAQAILTALAPPFSIDGREIYMAASIGITFFPRDGRSAAELLRNADSAMYTAKESGRNAICFFSPEMEIRAAQRLAIEGALRQALAHEELRVAYQPLVRTSDARPIGAEALLRWTSPTLGEVSPTEFIKVAEETGLIVPIGAWVLDQAVAEAARLRAEGYGAFQIAVNVSVRQFRGGDLAGLVSDTLKRHDFPAAGLELELTESLLLDVTPAITTTLQSLSALGVRLSLDDFGTGYSALSYLKTFPFDILKVDRSFIRDISSAPDSGALARAIIAMARGLGLATIVEGVETEEQCAFARAEDCDIMQGFLFGKAMTPADLRRMLDEKAAAE
ncbi:EAL domain-containing protein [Rhodospirillum rubrum]|nr:EAL domain-containing protein [Rhodospirillum rubrum]